MKIMQVLLAISLLSLGAFWYVTSRWLVAGLTPKATGINHYAIVLGAKVNGEIPSLSLAYRLEAAKEYAVAYPVVKLVLSGGQGEGEDITEAEAMRRYLIAAGIAESRLILEGKSTTTYENLKFSLNMIEESVTEITIISSDYHLMRAKWLANRFDLKVDVVAAKTPQTVEKKLRFRERIALIKTAISGK